MNKKICVIGLGYVGLPLAHAFSNKYQVVGFDINESRINELNLGFDRTLELSEDQVKEAISNGMKFSLDIKDIEDSNVYIVTVPTPIDKSNRPDLTPLIKSSQMIGKILKKDDIVIYESTVYPGVTEEVCVPELEKESGMKFNKDFFCGYSPERINPGDKEHTVTKILKVTSGSTPEIATIVDDLYSSIITAGTFKATSIKVAEAAKVIENTQRDVNIALINELALIFDNIGIDTNEVIEAAATKWNFIKLKPGLVGGHCIGVDPYYLTFKAEELGYKPNLILGARQINNGMGKYIAEQTVKQMIKNDKKIKDSNILILGVTFKENCPDLRNTKVTDIVDELREYGANIDIYDPWVDLEETKYHFNHELMEKNPFTENKKYDSIIIAVAHNEFISLSENDFKSISEGKEILIDIKGIVKNPTWRL
ncbi:nucleotide sugar dehydrogenase [Halarcobacter bivalviorum]|uniref:Polysaccharide biosynthesis protein, nucleotide sugar dehydrogenase, TviB family n=1 Tax=Halarcobacter bivalviorum TaxID=663364 RepID=A0AAX2AAN9_9BACT|nr:nucleotide sugar dehydrogenase [Halarcobacter bivalviorum]AXH11872.1 polysaccharide biosynthesis protein, nucleotide sugar dehydrogenase, TviB family [Halarcobacter bivalviorum]RXK10995.1 Vi polysaccharide biosynthesis protein VipA/TviB [Halarcobacter bivalviorum]